MIRGSSGITLSHTVGRVSPAALPLAGWIILQSSLSLRPVCRRCPHLSTPLAGFPLDTFTIAAPIPLIRAASELCDRQRPSVLGFT